MSIEIECDPAPKGKQTAPTDLACTVESGFTKETHRMRPGQRRSFVLNHKRPGPNDWLLLRRGGQDYGIMITNRSPNHLLLEETGSDDTPLDSSIKAGATRPLAPKVKRVRFTY